MKAFALVLASSAASALVLPSTPARAKVSQVSAQGFVIRHVAQVSASPEETWAVLIKPSVWWDSRHTWSTNAANLTLDARAGGCFCEILPDPASPKAAPRGSVEHMRVVYVERPRALRMVGALGPLQADAANATLTMQLKAGEKGGTQVLLEYVVSGYTRTPFEKLAPAVDAMLGEQVRRLAGKLGGAFSAAFPSPDAKPEGPAQPATPSDPEPVSGGETMDGSQVAAEEPAEGQLPADGIIPLSDEPPASQGPVQGR